MPPYSGQNMLRTPRMKAVCFCKLSQCVKEYITSYPGRQDCAIRKLSTLSDCFLSLGI